MAKTGLQDGPLPQRQLCTGDEKSEVDGPRTGLFTGAPASPQDRALTASPAALPTPPPDGRLTAWLQVLGSFLIFFNVLGIINAYGQFQTIYETTILSDMSSSTISWIGSVQFFLSYVVCILTGPVWDEGHLRYLVISGTGVSVFGLVMLSLCHSFWQIFLAQAIVVGGGFGLLFIPPGALIPQWFSTKTSLAIGIAVTGSSIGAIVYSVILIKLPPQIGFGWTVRVIALMMLVTMLCALALVRLRDPPPSSKRALFDFKQLRDVPFLLTCIGFFAGVAGVYVFYYYITLYAIDEIGTDPNLAFYLLTILNAGSIFGRLFPNFAAVYYGPMNVQVLFCAMSGVLAFCLLTVKTTPGITAFSALYGFVSGSFLALPIPVINNASSDKSVLGTRLGMCFAFMGTGVLIGEPIAGAILGRSENWAGVVIWSGVMLVASAIIVGIARVVITGPVLRVKA